jgi:Uma2 family endonuclease
VTTPSTSRLTPQEYLARERAAERKSEYLAGEVFEMSGASREHNLLVTNLVRELSLQLRGRECEVYPSDMRVKVAPSGLYTYPDVVVVCGEPNFEDEETDTLLNPTLIVEVLSKSTEGYDRGEKFEHYRRLDSLREYVLVAQDKCHVERYVRQPDQQWLFSEIVAPEGSLELVSLGCRLAMHELYEKVRSQSSES